MDALILSCGTGGGHNSAAAAIREELIRRGHHVEVADPYTLTQNHVDRFVNQGYIKLVQKIPAAFGFIYFLGNVVRRLPTHSPVYYLNKKMIPPILDLLKNRRFDVIIMSHIFPEQILTAMKEQGIEIPKTVLIATDYTCIPFTEEVDCDCCIIPAQDLKPEFTRYGIPEERLHPLGIPVRRSFEDAPSRAEALQNLGLDPQKRYCMVSGGSMGAGKLVKVISILSRHFQGTPVELIVICGSNRKLYDKLNKTYQKNIHLVLSTTQMADYMKACDLVVSKPGGLSSTEAAVSGSPLIHISPIPGCESRNMKYFSSHGMSIAVYSLKKELIPAVEQLLDPQQAEQLRRRQQSTVCLHSADRICSLIESGCCEGALPKTCC